MADYCQSCFLKVYSTDINFTCKTCYRVFHGRCVKNEVSDINILDQSWKCKDCRALVIEKNPQEILLDSTLTTPSTTPSSTVTVHNDMSVFAQHAALRMVKFCRACRLEVDSDEVPITCSKCWRSYHTRCVNIHSEVFLDHQRWSCKECKLKEEKEQKEQQGNYSASPVPETPAAARPSLVSVHPILRLVGFCQACLAGVYTNEFRMTCSSCWKTFHCTCINMSIRSIELMNERRQRWFCNDCISSAQVNVSKHLPKIPQSSNSPGHASFAGSLTTNNDSGTFMSEIKIIKDTVIEAVAEILVKLDDLRNEMDKINPKH